MKGLIFFAPLLFLIGFGGRATLGQTPVADPVPSVKSTPTFVWKREFAVIPPSSSGRPLARINQVEPFSRANGWLGVNDLNGLLYMVNYQGAVQLYLDLKDAFPQFRRSPGRGTGFTSFAAHPEFDENGIFYTSHTEAGNSGTPTIPLPQPVDATLQGVVVEWTASNPADPVFSGTRREILRIDLTGTIHGFQEIAFRPAIPEEHPDYGLLFICIGEAQTLQRGPLANIGTPASPIGTLFRIDPRGENGPNGQYGIPPDNPFVGQTDALGEILAYGFRNPHRLTWNTRTGDLLLTDIGERQVEELNLIEPGLNYGWPVREGPFVLNPEGNTDVVFPLPPDDEGFTYPVAMYDHDEGFAIAGGPIYRNSRIPKLKDRFLASDIRSGRLYLLPADELEQGTVTPFRRWFMRGLNGIIDPPQMVGSGRADLRIGEDHFGEIYFLTKQDGIIRKFIGEDEPPSGYGIFEGYPWADHWVDSGELMGLVNVLHYPWTWVEALGGYIHAAPSDSPSGWVYRPR